MARPLRWGILGTGGIARKFATQLPQSARAKLVAVGSRCAAGARSFADDFPCTAHDGYDCLLADPNVEAVYVSLPNSLHHRWTIAALEAGKHVLCEKPIAANAGEAQEMFDTADRTGRVLMEAFMYRHQPAIRKLLQTVHGGAIGNVKLIRAHFTYNRPVDTADVRYRPDLAGGSLMDVGCYCINFARAVAQREPTSMYAVAQLHSTGVDEYAAATLRFGDGPLCVFTCGMTVDADRTSFIGGSAGWLAVDTPWFGCEAFTFDAGGRRRTIEHKAPMEVYALEADALAATIQDGTTPTISRADTLGNMRVLDKLRKVIGLSC